MAQITFTLSIRKGTVVVNNDLSRKNQRFETVELAADVCVEGATFHPELGYTYRVGNTEYGVTSYGDYVIALQEKPAMVEEAIGWRHRDGLVTLCG